MAFLDVCRKLATNEAVTIGTDEMEVPEHLKTRTDALIESMKPKMDRLDKISISFIENVFDDCHIEDFGVCTGILNKLSNSLYGKLFDDLVVDEQAIIKVLTGYICIQK